MKNNDLQPRLLYPAKLSFKIEGEIRNFPEKKKLKESVNTKSLLLQMLKDLKEKKKEKGKGKKEEEKEKEEQKEEEEEEEEEKKKNRGKQSNNKMALHAYLSIMTVNVNGLNAPTKRRRVADWIRKQDPYIYFVYKTHLKTKDTNRLKVRR